MLISFCEKSGFEVILFSSLTSHTSYMNESLIVEAGTHEALLERDREYAKIWKLQAQAFL